MKPRTRRCAVTTVLLLCAIACDDAIVGRRWPIEAPSSAGASAGSTSADPSCPSGIKVRPAVGVCATVPAQGDVDCNGKVDIVDALKVGQVVDGVQSYPLYGPAGDLNCDGCLTDEDATLIAQVSAGKSVAHSCDDSE